MQILVAEHLAYPEDGFGLQQAVLEKVAAGSRGPTALLWTSSRYLGTTRLETRLPNFGEAVRRAEEASFPVLVRNSGGGAVAANEGSVSFSLTFPVGDLRYGLHERYAEGVELVAAALRRVGVETEAGEVEGEFCPGAYSIRSGGPRGVKHAGLAQRVTRRAARLEALILVSKTGALVPVLRDFYASLVLPFRSSSVGDLEGVSVPQVIGALSAEVVERYAAVESRVDEGLLSRAHSHCNKWQIPSEIGDTARCS